MSSRAHDPALEAVREAILLGAILLTLPVGAAGPGGSSHPARDDAQQALAEGRYAEAEVAFRARLIEDPSSLAALEG